MMLIVRLYPKYGPEKVWDFVRTRFKECNYKGCSPLYASQTEATPHIAVVFSVRDVDQLGEFFSGEVPNCPDIKKSQTITLMKPAFFPVPKDRPEGMERYRVALKLHTNGYKSVYDSLLHHDYSNKLFPTYVAMSFGEDDILMSIIASDREELDRFIKEVLEPMEGVRGVKAALVTHSERLMPRDEWWTLRRSLYRIKPTEKHDEEYDWTLDEHHAMLTGAFRDEL